MAMRTRMFLIVAVPIQNLNTDVLMMEPSVSRPIFCTKWSERVYMAFAPFKVEFSPGRIASGAGGR